MPTLKGTHVQCFLYLVSSINVSFSYYMAGYFMDRPRIIHIPYKIRANELFL